MSNTKITFSNYCFCAIEKWSLTDENEHPKIIKRKLLKILFTHLSKYFYLCINFTILPSYFQANNIDGNKIILNKDIIY